MRWPYGEMPRFALDVTIKPCRPTPRTHPRVVSSVGAPRPQEERPSAAYRPPWGRHHSAQKELSCGSTIATHSGQARPSADQSISMPAASMLRASVDFQPPAPSNGT
jgi:hypothetical protein